MAVRLKSRTTTLLSHKPRVLSSFFTERWFGVLVNQDYLVHKASCFIGGDAALPTDWLRASFSTCLGLSDKRVVEMKATDAHSNIPDENHKPQQDQVSIPTSFFNKINESLYLINS
ncbi:hypothetical protein Hdeb2414_s0028g00697991 [Helianthus debilis subsp. tardiflorus]